MCQLSRSNPRSATPLEKPSKAKRTNKRALGEIGENPARQRRTNLARRETSRMVSMQLERFARCACGDMDGTGVLFGLQLKLAEPSHLQLKRNVSLPQNMLKRDPIEPIGPSKVGPRPYWRQSRNFRGPFFGSPNHRSNTGSALPGSTSLIIKLLRIWMRVGHLHNSMMHVFPGALTHHKSNKTRIEGREGER